MKDGEHYHNQGDPEGKHSHRKLAGIILLAVISAFVAYGVAQTAQTTADNNANITNVFEVVVNNTDIGCYGGEGGTCERVNGTTYSAANYSRNVYLKYHIVDNNAHTVFYVYINGTVVLWRDFTTIQADQNESFAFNIPKGANFSYYNNSIVHHVEWREYPILSGRNGTLTLNQTFITSGSNFNATYDQTTIAYNNNYSSQTFPNGSIYGLVDILNSSKVNKTGDNMTGLLNANAGINTSFLLVKGNKFATNFNLSVPTETSSNYFMDLNGTDGVTFSIRTLDNSAVSFANFRTEAESNIIQFTSHASARTSSRFGVTVGGWSEIVNTNGGSGNTNGMIIGTTANKPLLFGTNALGRMNISADGNITVLTAGKGIILKSPDGTKCGFLNWTDANTFLTTATTCP